MEEIKKLDLESKDIIADKVEQLKQLFPEVATEGNGSIDWARLKEVLGEEVNEDDERYAFTWPGKHDAIKLSQTPSTATLRPCKEESVDWDSTENLYIEGDNLEVLKLLQRSYAGKIKMIYIDPPYNTGHDFVYKDKFENTVENYKVQCGLAGQANADTSGRYHSIWCSMMMSRLSLAKNLLSDDGAIFISIDDNEQIDLGKLCDEIFGETNKIAEFVWKSKPQGGNDNPHVVTEHEYIFAYAKNINKLTTFGRAIDTAKYTLRDEYYSDRGAYHRAKLDLATLGYRVNLDYPVVCPDGSTLYPGNVTKDEWKKRRNNASNNVRDWQWRWSEEKLKKALELGIVEFVPKDNSWGLYTKEYEKCDYDGNCITRTIKYRTIIDNCTTINGTNEIANILGKRIFSYPKPVDLISTFIKIITNQNEIILDFFSGSCTTADAVMRANENEGTFRKFIMVQLPEETDGKSEAYAAGYNNICEIGKERIRRVGRQIKEEVEKSSKQLMLDEEPKKTPDTGFKVLKLDESNIEIPKDGQMQFDLLKDDRSDLDIVYEMMLKWGLELSSLVEEKNVNGYYLYSISADDTICCLDNGLNLEILQAIAELNPRKVLFKDSVLTDTLKVNAIQIFKKQGDKNGLEIDLRTI